MAAPTHIQVYTVAYDGTGNETRSIKTVTKPPYIAPSRPSGLSPLESQDFKDKELKKIHQTCVLLCKDPHASELTTQYLPLPDVQPECPEDWEADAWEFRAVAGNAKFHMFCPGFNRITRELNRPFILRVSDVLPDGKLVYEDIDDESREQMAELNEFMSGLKKWSDTLEE